WTGEAKTYIHYELGDQVIINNSNVLPTGINNVSTFMIFDKQVDFTKGNPKVKFKLMELP
ncbi:MAG: hypothetical protein NUV80_00205, partial [Candidatus Berkelbacteria bacterium]|nr:hypothetical protein [Candidatus Berkelbacteria bacterium]